MSTEQQPVTQQPATAPHPANEPKQEPNALATGLTNAWDNFKQGKLLSYPMMAVLLLVVAGIGGGIWYYVQQADATSARWTVWDSQSTTAELQKFAEDPQYANTIQAKLANLRIAQIHLETEGINKMFAKPEDFMTGPQSNPAEAAKKAQEARETGVKNVEKAREEFKKLADDFKDDPVIHVQCLYAQAKAEAVLVGVPKEGKQPDAFDLRPLAPADSRGDPAKAVELLDKVVAAAPDTDWGKDAKKLADALRNQSTEEQVRMLQGNLFGPSPSLPKLPGDSPILPPGHP